MTDALVPLNRGQVCLGSRTSLFTLLLGVLLVLLTPCIDYVIVFTGLAGGARAKLLAAAPLLMLLQLALLPLYLFAFAGREFVGVIDVAPFAEAFLLLIVVPLAAAAAVQALARRHGSGRAIEGAMAGAMVPLMMITLATVIGSQAAGGWLADRDPGTPPTPLRRIRSWGCSHRCGCFEGHEAGYAIDAGGYVLGRDPQLPGGPSPRAGPA